MRAVRGTGRSLSDHHVIQCKVRLVGPWIKRREVVTTTDRIRSGILRVHQYIEGYGRYESKKVEWDKG